MKGLLKKGLALFLSATMMMSAETVSSFAFADGGVPQTQAEMQIPTDPVATIKSDGNGGEAAGGININEQTEIYFDVGESHDFTCTVKNNNYYVSDVRVTDVYDRNETRVTPDNAYGYNGYFTASLDEKNNNVIKLTAGDPSIVGYRARIEVTVTNKNDPNDSSANRRFDVNILKPIGSLAFGAIAEGVVQNRQVDIGKFLWINGLSINNYRTTISNDELEDLTTDVIEWDIPGCPTITNEDGETVDIATVPDGVINSISSGNVTIRAYAKDPHKPKDENNVYGQKNREVAATQKITINAPNPITKIELDKSKFIEVEKDKEYARNIDRGQELNINALFIYTKLNPDADYTDHITWETNKPEVANVSATGSLKAVSSGSATITAKVEGQTGDSYSASFTVRVIAHATSLKQDIDNKIEYIEVGTEQTISLTEADGKDGGANDELKWTVSPSDVVEIISAPYNPDSAVQRVKVKGKKQGDAVLTATSTHNPAVKKDINIKVINEADRNFKVTPGDSINSSLCPVYTGSDLESEIEKLLTITDNNGQTLTKNADYTLSYSSETITEAGDYSVTVKGNTDNGIYGEYVISFKVNPRPISDSFTLSGVEDKTYNFGEQLTQYLSVENDLGAYLSVGADFTLSYANNINASTDAAKASVTVTGCGNYSGSRTLYFNILPYSLDGITFNIEYNEYTFTSKGITPKETLTYNNGTIPYVLVKDRDYTVSYKNNINVGSESYVIVTGKGNFTGTQETIFNIIKKNVENDVGGSVTIDAIPDQGYNGGAQLMPNPVIKHNGVLLTYGADYVLNYKNNRSPGTATVEIFFDFDRDSEDTSPDNFTGTRTITFNIKDRKPKKAATGLKITSLDADLNSVAELPNESITYVDTRKKKYVLVELVGPNGCDDAIHASGNAENETITAAIGYIDGTNGQKAIIEVTGNQPGSYDMTLSTMSGQVNRTLYFVTLEPATEIRILSGNTDISSDSGVMGASVVENHALQLTASLEPYTSTDKVEWSVNDKTIAEIDDKGVLKAKKPGTVVVTATLYADTPPNPFYRGLTATASINISKANPITKLTLAHSSVQLEMNQSFDAASILTKQIENPNNGTTDKLTWTSSDETIATVDPITGIVTTLDQAGEVDISVSTDTLTPIVAKFRLKVIPPARDIEYLLDSMKLEYYAKDYTGSALKPSVTIMDGDVKLKNGTDYTVAYSNNKNIGTATVKITGTGAFKGSAKLTFTINPAAPKNFRNTSTSKKQIKLTWSKSAGATGYIVEMDQGGDYWTQVKSTKSTSYKLKTDSAYAKYNFRVRAYKKVNGKTYEGSNSTASVTAGVSDVTGVKVSKTEKTALTISWKKNKSAKGYEVQMLNGKKWKTVKKINKNSTVKYRQTKLKSNKTYKFRVRTVKKVGKKKYYGSYQTVSGKTK